jgi:CDP-diglyceride synthetase
MAGLIPTGSGCGRDTHTLLWVLVCFAIALCGGGPYFVGRAIGKEL